ncbi:MAG: hypothetical protein AUI36_39185, partial [Cyanobacteria bacterium 13_1_40CM_2_61_4]
MTGLKKEGRGEDKAYVVGDEVFGRKADVQKRAHDILWRYNPQEDLGATDLAFLRGLLRNHPRAREKIGSGVVSICVRVNPGFPENRNRGFWLTRTDGTGTDFSYLKCISPIPQERLFKIAARRAVAAQLDQFKTVYFQECQNEGGLVRCPVTGDWIARGDAQVDHEHPMTFDALLNEFIHARGIDTSRVEIAGLEDGAIGRSFSDRSLLRDWREYHQQRAHLR